jgi:IS5 family transposase
MMSLHYCITKDLKNKAANQVLWNLMPWACANTPHRLLTGAGNTNATRESMVAQELKEQAHRYVPTISVTKACFSVGG